MSKSRVAERSATYALKTAVEPAFETSFDLLATAPQGVAKLRELILSMALRGLLVPHSHADEPSKELLTRSRRDRAKQIAAGRAKRERPASPVQHHEERFALPSRWTWCRVVDTGEYINGLAFKPSDWGKSGRPIIRIQNLSGRNQDFNRTTKDVDASVIVKSGDILVSWSATLDAFIWRGEEGVLNQHIFRVTPSLLVERDFLFWLLKGVIKELAASDHAHGLVMSHINRGPFLAYPVAIPPLAEQARIVARVEELMQLCDALEAHGRLQDEQHARLVATLFDALAASASAKELAENWQRIATHFDLLLDRPEAVDALDQTLLQLAIRGSLVPQDSTDEPAAVLATRIRGEKVATDGRRVRRMAAEFLPVEEDEVGFSAPAGWTYVRFGDITINRDGERIPVSASERESRAKSYDYYGASGVIDKIDGYLFDKRLLLIGEDGANLLNRSTPIAFFADGRYWVNNHAHVIDATEPRILEYLRLYINAISLAPYVTGTAQPKMNQAKLNGIPVALPPLAEQHRIVARVEQLRRLCADLRERLQQARATQSRLADALVSAAQSPTC